MTEPAATTAPPPPPDRASFAEDLVDIFFAPAKVFARRARSSPVAPYLVVSIVMIVLFFASRNALAPIFDAQIQKAIDAAMKANPSQVTPAVADRMRPMIGITITVGGIVGVPVVLLLLGLVTWVLGQFVLDGRMSYGTGLLIASFSWMPRILGSVIGLVEGLTMDVSRMTSPYQLSLGVARFFDPSSMSDGLYQLLGQVDLFAIWSAALVAVGLMHAGKIGKGKAAVGGVVLWIVGAVPAIWAVMMGR